MPSLKQLQDEVRAAGSPFDITRRKYIKELSVYTGRNVITYYSGWLQKVGFPKEAAAAFSVTDADKNGFMSAIHQLDRSKGLDLILHTPGGDIAATESLVDYLRAMFGNDIRAIVPQLAMSAGTMISLSCSSVLMGKESSLGPIDPQIGGIPAHGVLEEFKRAKDELKSDPSTVLIWQPIIAKYTPTLIGECEKATQWAEEMVQEWLVTGMFLGDAKAEAKAKKIVAEFADHAETKSHARHFSAKKAKACGIKVEMLESDSTLQDLVLTVHHANILTLSSTNAVKIIENSENNAFIQSMTVGTE